MRGSPDFAPGRRPGNCSIAPGFCTVWFDQLSTDLFVLASYVQSVAPNDQGKLATTGFPMRQARVRTRILVPPTAPANFELQRGPVSGMLVARASPQAGVGSYDVQLTTADPAVESSWMPAGTFKNCSRIELPGLTPGKVYMARIRALGTAGPGDWAIAAGLMVV